MANYAALKTAIEAAIYENHNNEITGDMLQEALLAMVNSLGVGYQYAGIATPATNPGTPDQNIFYLASTAGTYPNFSGLVVDDGEIAILKYNGAWVKDSTGAASSDEKVDLQSSTSGYNELDLSSFPKYAVYVGSDGKWGDGGNKNASIIIPVAAGDIIKITATNTDNYYAFLTSDAHTAGTNVSFADITPARVLVNSGASVEITISDSSNALFLAVRDDSVVSGFKAPRVYEYQEAAVTQDDLVEGYAIQKQGVFYSPMLKTVNDLLTGGRTALAAEQGKIIGQQVFDTPIVTTSFQKVNLYISSQGAWGSDTPQAYTIFVPVAVGDKIKITPEGNNGAVYAILTDNSILTVNFATGEDSRHIITATTTVEITQNDAHYLAVRADANIRDLFAEPTMVHLSPILEMIRHSGNTEIEISQINYETTDIIATTRNLILRDSVENGTHYFYFSNNGGKTFTKTENTIGLLGFVHFFSDDTCLLCAHQHCYTTKDFTTFVESTVYDADGNIFVPNKVHFFSLLNNLNEMYSLNGEEVIFWSDYNVQSNYQSRIWLASDKGATIRCICKNNETTTTDNETISCRHFHDIYFIEEEKTLLITTGDFGDQNFVLKGIWNDSLSKFEFTKIDSGRCWGQIWPGKFNYYIMTDHPVDDKSGIVVADKTNMDNYSWIYETENGQQLSSFWEDEYRTRVIFPDGATKNLIFIARKNFEFNEVNFGNTNYAMNNILGANLNGDVVARLTDGYTTEQNAETHLAINRTDIPRFNLGKALRDAGIRDFGKGMRLE